jgi:hypothetical protein
MNIKMGALLAACMMASITLTGTARAEDGLFTSGKLLLTGGVSNIEGAGGGGLATWSTITGYETTSGIGGNVHGTYVHLPDYSLRDYGVAIGFYDRFEISYARQEFDTGSTGGKLGLGNNFTFDQDVFGAKIRIIGDAVYDQDSWLPQIAVGAQYKRNDRDAIIHAVGGKSDHGIDYYIAATKLLIDSNILLNGTLRFTKANQTGLLGFGGDRNDSYRAQVEASAAYLLSRRFAIGAEYRTKPNNLGFAKESDWYDVFAAYAINKNLSITAAYVDLGSIATFQNQRGVYFSLQAGL